MKNFSKRPWSRRSFLAGTGAVAAGLSFLPKKGWSAEEAKVNFYNWDTYIGETTISDFQDATGIEVNYDLFADNDELFAKLKGGNPGYDLIVPTNDFTERMILAEMIQPLDHSLIPNFANLDPAFQDSDFDPGRKYSMPYMWGTMGIGYRKSRVDGVPDSWQYIFDSDKYAGTIAWLSEPGSMTGMALKYLGYSFNSTSEKELKEAEALMIKQKPRVKVIAEDNGQDLLLSGEVDIAVEWNGDLLQVMEEDDDLSYVVPKEGSLLWQDTLAIPVGAPHPENAHKLINFLLDAEAGAAIADYIYYATPNKAAKALMGPEYTENPAIFPSDETLAKCESAIYLGEDRKRIIDEAWTRISAA
ncbi:MULTISPECIES: PotD/PotF family extracellular solute-binding protein [Limibacillus]|jgi:spermidine/putrescine transport system substrate-binding protein|uniref:Putrescine-binding periplasmic protein n=1 Tax=Limibacillus halophilus TaxID=1579333 RepID=A0A839STR0_9PROT|nr:spermidine/putrescine ABC transporter substrate-binding protein [Limibacillus halophilus]MBB3065134.1 spermidine/putrescine transport system substrate-binding protein [Limibacillus halophilus]